MSAYPFTDLVTMREVTLHMGDEPGVEHPDCIYRAEVIPSLDSFYCTHCGWNGRISGAWFMDLLTAEEVRYCPDGVLTCTDCDNGADLMSCEVCDSCGRSAPTEDRSDCPYFRRYAGIEGADPEGICSYGCREEPSCVTDRPRYGWPSEQAALPAVSPQVHP